MITSDIWKVFDRVGHQGLQLKHSRNGISGNILAIIKTFLIGEYMKVVINGQSYEAHEINVGVI